MVTARISRHNTLYRTRGRKVHAPRLRSEWHSAVLWETPATLITDATNAVIEPNRLGHALTGTESRFVLPRRAPWAAGALLVMIAGLGCSPEQAGEDARSETAAMSVTPPNSPYDSTRTSPSKLVDVIGKLGYTATP